MDILAHALWTGAAATGVRRKWRPPISMKWAVFWGIFPDVFSFAIPALVRIWWYATGTTRSLLPEAHGPQHFQFVWQLYYSSHSLVTFGIVFALAWLIARRPVWEMLAWSLHIVADIFTHTGIFALHFLWPLSSYGFSGIRWESWRFQACNYGALAATLGWIWAAGRNRNRRTTTEKDKWLSHAEGTN
jgi:hypothetical protein